MQTQLNPYITNLLTSTVRDILLSPMPYSESYGYSGSPIPEEYHYLFNDLKIIVQDELDKIEYIRVLDKILKGEIRPFKSVNQLPSSPSPPVFTWGIGTGNMSFVYSTLPQNIFQKDKDDWYIRRDSLIASWTVFFERLFNINL